MPESLNVADILGVGLIDTDFFIENARIFGCGAIIEDWNRDQVEGIIALASRAVEAYCGRDFTPDTIAEMHKWNPRTRRITVMQPPVSELVSYNILVGPNGPRASFPITDIFINNQENYLELSSLAFANTLVEPVMSLGILEPQVEVTYKSYQSVPTGVRAAVALTAAEGISKSNGADILSLGLSSMKIGDMSVTRSGAVAQESGMMVPQRAQKLLLQNVSRVVVA